MPEPDYMLPDGSRTYSVQGLRKLMQWQQRKPSATRRSGWRSDTPDLAAVQVPGDDAAGFAASLGDAAGRPHMPGFTDNEADVVAALKADPRISLERPCQKVVLPRMQADRNKVREEVLKELKTKPTATSAPVAPTPAPSSTARSTEDIAREIISKSSNPEVAGLPGSNRRPPAHRGFRPGRGCSEFHLS